MRKYKLTTKGKLVIATLCTFVIAYIALGISSIMKETPEYYDYSQPKEKVQQDIVVQDPPKVEEVVEKPFDNLKVAIYFEANMTSFDKEYYEALNIFSNEALKQDSIKIQVEGNCATQFPENSKQKSINYNLSMLRAQTVANYLQSKGIDTDRLIVVSNGSDKPIKDNSTPEGRKSNRRVDVYFLINNK